MSTWRNRGDVRKAFRRDANANAGMQSAEPMIVADKSQSLDCRWCAGNLGLRWDKSGVKTSVSSARGKISFGVGSITTGRIMKGTNPCVNPIEGANRQVAISVS